MSARTPRYFVLVMDGRPLTQPSAPDVPAVFQNEQSALLEAGNLDLSTEQIVLERYAADLDFLDRQFIRRSAPAPY